MSDDPNILPPDSPDSLGLREAIPVELLSPLGYASRAALQAPRLRKGLAITALVLSVLGLLLVVVPVIPPIALVLGIIALRRARRWPERYGGEALALAAIVLSVLDLIVAAWLLHLLVAAMRDTGCTGYF
jgi:hypothetical protein